MTKYSRKKKLKLNNNKEFVINDIKGLEIINFRLLQNQKFNLSQNITLVSGRNGTMKSTVMGLVAQPFISEFIDLNNNKMQTKFSEVFRLSSINDTSQYLYNIKMNINQNLNLIEPIPLYYDKNNDRHRLVPSGRSKGDGYFNLPSIYLNLKRLFPLVNLDKIKATNIKYSESERRDIAQLFERVLLKVEFNKFDNFTGETGNLEKNPIGPKDSNYDVTSISSGEDNLGVIANTLISFQRVYAENKRYKDNRLTGILSIDEFESSLHPVSQINLLKYLMDWSKRFKVKIILNTHSLFLIEFASRQTNWIKHNRLNINLITNAGQKDNKLVIIENPSFLILKQELTLESNNLTQELIKVRVLCEDDVAVGFIKRIVKPKISKYCLFQAQVNNDNEGTNYLLLTSLAKKYPKLLRDSRSVIILDGDVADSHIVRANSDRVLKIPTISQLCVPLEKDLVYFILSLEGDDLFFVKFGKTKDIFKNDFVNYRIPLNINEIESNCINSYKNWFQSLNGSTRNSYINYMIKNNNKTFDGFISTFKELLNKVLDENGLPMIV